MKPPALTECTDADELTREAAGLLALAANKAIEENGRFVLGLSGGSTPGPAYELFGKTAGIDWSKVWIFLADDRLIRPDAPKSNQFLIRSTLLKHAAIPESQIVFPDPTLSIEDCVAKYAAEILALKDRHGIDLIVLGMGDDGHIASLFPPLDDRAFAEAATHTTTTTFDVFDRVSVTLPVLKAARQTLLLLKGATKKQTWEDMLAGEDGPNRWPLKALINRRDALMTVLYAA